MPEHKGERRNSPRKQDAAGLLEDAAWALMRAAHRIEDLELLIKDTMRDNAARIAKLKRGD